MTIKIYKHTSLIDLHCACCDGQIDKNEYCIGLVSEHNDDVAMFMRSAMHLECLPRLPEKVRESIVKKNAELI